MKGSKKNASIPGFALGLAGYLAPVGHLPPPNRVVEELDRVPHDPPERVVGLHVFRRPREQPFEIANEFGLLDVDDLVRVEPHVGRQDFVHVVEPGYARVGKL